MPYQKDISTLRDFLANGADILLPVAKCIRPYLEGTLRHRYFGQFENDTLGNMIAKIKKSTPQDKINNLCSIIEDLEDLNDYSQTFHHSQGNQIEDSTIDEAELTQFTRGAFRLLGTV